MPETSRFQLPSGAWITVVSTAPEPVRAGPQEASTASRALEAWSDGAALVAEVGSTVVDQLRAAFQGVEEVSVEFGANISGKTGVILVEGSVSANLKVVVTWKAPKPEA